MCQKDRQYVRLCLDGEPEAFRHLVFRYQGRLVSYLTGRLGDGQRAGEAAQETFVRAYFALRRLRKPDSFFSWLLGIADRVVKETYRDRRRETAPLRCDLVEDKGESPGSDADVRQAVAALPDLYRQTVLLRYYGGLSCAEVSSELGVPLGTVTKRLSRAYALLRKSLRVQQQKDYEVQS